MDNAYFTKIIEQHKDRLFAIAFNYFKNSHDSDDVVQEVFIKFYNVKKEFESDEHIRNWLIKVTINQCKKILVSSWFKKHVALEEYANGLSFETTEESDLFYAVMNIPKKYRVVVHLYYYEGYNIKEISELLRIKETAISTRLMRARKILKECLKEIWEDEK